MQRIWSTLSGFVRTERGQDLIEYALLAGLIAVMALAAVATLGLQIRNTLWQTIVDNL